MTAVGNQVEQQSKIYPNSCQIPNIYLDQYMAFLTGEEWKVLSYTVRRTMGFRKYEDQISLSQYATGLRSREGKQLDNGTGLSKPAINTAITKLLDFGLIIQTNPSNGNEGASYALQLDDTRINHDKIMERHNALMQKNKSRTKTMRSKRAEKRAVSGTKRSKQKSVRSVGHNASGQSDITRAVSRTDTQKIVESQGKKEDSGQPANAVAASDPDHLAQPGNMVNPKLDSVQAFGEAVEPVAIPEESGNPPYTSFISKSRNPEPKESSAKEKVVPGDKVYYRYRAGWGGGETAHAAGLVCRVMSSKTEIILVDHKHGAAQCVKKTVELTSLDKRETGSQYDDMMQAFMEQVEPLTTCNSLPSLPDGLRWYMVAGDNDLLHAAKPTHTGKLIKPICGHPGLHAIPAQGATVGKRQPCMQCQRSAAAPPPPKERPRDLVFDAIALGSFNMTQVANGSGGRIAKVAKQVKECTAVEHLATLPQDLTAMYAYFKRKYPDLSAPSTAETICKYLAEVRAIRKPTPNGKPKADPNCGKCHGSGIETVEDARGYRISNECSCVQEARHGYSSS